MPNHYAQPYFSENKIRFYDKSQPINASNPDFTLDLSEGIKNWGPGKNGPNNVVIYKNKIFVSLDLDGGSKGGVLIYNYSSVGFAKNATRNPPADLAIKPSGGDGIASIGIAIDPKTGDLYIPTFGGDPTKSGIYKYTAASNYMIGSQFSSRANDPTNVSQFCANLAFDTNNNLWMTTFPNSNEPNQHFLICYKGLDKNKVYKIINRPTRNYTATSTSGVNINVHLLSAPEGIAFDASGNLWLGNNNDERFVLTNPPVEGTNQGTFVKITKGWLDDFLSNPVGVTKSIDPTPTFPEPVKVYYLRSGKLGGLTFDGNTLFINDQGQNQGSSFTASGTVWKWDITTTFNTTNFKPSGIFTTYPGNGGGALVEPFLVIQDNPADIGSQPNATTTNAWDSRDIWVRQTNDGKTLGNNITQEVLGGQLSYVYVRISNKGITPTSGDEKIILYWAKASTGLGWPAPWDGSNNIPSPIKGEQIVQIDLSSPNVIQPNTDGIVEFRWAGTPNPINYGGDEHFCLLARIVTSPAPLLFTDPALTPPFSYGLTEQLAVTNPLGVTNPLLISNVLNNNKIAWRNIHITGVAAKIRPGSIIVANYLSVRINAKINFELLNSQGNRVELGTDKLLIGAKGIALEQLNQTDFSRNSVEVLEDGQFSILDIENGIENIILEPGETLTLAVQYIPTKKTEGYVLRVKQFVQDGATSVLVGGQTFVDGKVKGLPVEIIDEKTDETKDKYPSWLWILIILLIILIIGLLIAQYF